MIEQALKVIASFKDEASAGIKKLQAQIDSLSKNKTPLGVADPKAADAINKTNSALRTTNQQTAQASKNVKDLVGNLRGLAGPAGTISTQFGEIQESLSALVSTIPALFAGLTAAGTATQSRYAQIAQEVNAAGRAAYAEARALGASVVEAEKLRSSRRAALTVELENATVLGRIQNLYKGINAKVSGNSSSINKLRLSTNLPSAASLGALAAGVTAFGTAIAAAVGGLSLALNAAADDAAELAEKLGITVNQLKAYQLIADETGTSVEGIVKAQDRLVKVLDKTDEESDKAAVSLSNLGLSFEQIKKLSPAEAAGKILERYEALGKSAEATAAVQVLLGSSFRESSLGLKEAAKNFAEYADRVKAYGAGESKILIEQGKQQETAVNNLSLAFAGFGKQLAEGVGPALTIIIQSFADTLNAIRKTEIAGKIVQVVFGAIKLLIVDLGRLIGGLAASMVAFFSGDFKQASIIAKEAFSDAYDAVANFGQKTEVAKESVEGLSEAEAKAAVAAAKAAAARKKAAEEQAKLFKDAEDDLYRQLALMSAISEADKLQYEIDKGKYKTLSANQKALLVDLAQMIDLKKKEQDVDALKKDKQAEIDQQKVATSLAEEELRLAGLSTAEREAQIYVITELNKLRTEGKDIDEATLIDMQQQIKVLGKRKQALIEAQEAAKTTAEIIADSEATISASVMRNIDLAKELLATRKITEADYARYVIAQTKRITDLNQEAADQTVEFWRAAAQGIQGALSNSINDIINGDLNSLVNNVKKAIDQIVANFLAAQLAATLFGSSLEKGGQVGGLVGQAGTFLSGLFGGARAAGGPVDAGKVYMVGEKGPELVQMGGSGSVVSNDKLGSLGKTVNVNFRVEAIDASSFRSKIDEFKRDIAAAVSDSNLSYGV